MYTFAHTSVNHELHVVYIFEDILFLLYHVVFFTTV